MIKLKSGEVLEVENISQPSEDTLEITVIGITDYNAFRAKLTKTALSDIKAYNGDNLTGDYGKYPNVVFPIGIAEQEDGTIKASVTLKKENETEVRLAAVEDAVDKMILSELGVL
ncbi:MAG: hypothetical protein K0R92_512 [Lachnospiraceae bacterium]|jgi:hypothetical protein|nr:hypothetical protein [Lachnospiraceae bacterium]